MTLADGVRYAPTLTSMSWPGWPIATLAMPPGASEEQCAAVITCVGVTSEPVHWNARSISTCATYGYSPGEAGAPPTTAWAGALTPQGTASVRRSVPSGLMSAPTTREGTTGGLPALRFPQSMAKRSAGTWATDSLPRAEVGSPGAKRGHRGAHPLRDLPRAAYLAPCSRLGSTRRHPEPAARTRGKETAERAPTPA